MVTTSMWQEYILMEWIQYARTGNGSKRKGKQNENKIQKYKQWKPERQSTRYTINIYTSYY